jgi:hypothetical protein
VSAREALRLYAVISKTNGDVTTDLYKELKALLDPKQEIYNKYIEKFSGISNINYYGIQYILEAEVFKEKSKAEEQLDNVMAKLAELQKEAEQLQETIKKEKK